MREAPVELGCAEREEKPASEVASTALRLARRVGAVETSFPSAGRGACLFFIVTTGAKQPVCSNHLSLRYTAFVGVVVLKARLRTLRPTVRWALVGFFVASPCLAQTSHPPSDDSVANREPERVCLSEVLIRAPQSGSPAQITEAQRKAEQVRNSARAGTSFSDLAKANSQGPHAAQGGGIGCYKRGVLSKQLEDRVFKLQVGEVSDVLRTKQGFVVLQVTEHGTP
jgi:PPIC-type PPIASE domain